LELDEIHDNASDFCWKMDSIPFLKLTFHYHNVLCAEAFRSGWHAEANEVGFRFKLGIQAMQHLLWNLGAVNRLRIDLWDILLMCQDPGPTKVSVRNMECGT
jgi:hypothetical protein